MDESSRQLMNRIILSEEVNLERKCFGTIQRNFRMPIQYSYYVPT